MSVNRLDGRGHVHLQRALLREGHRCRAVELIHVQELNQVADDDVHQGDRGGADTTTPTYTMKNVNKEGPCAAVVLRCSSHALSAQPCLMHPHPSTDLYPGFLLTWLVHGWKTGHALQVQHAAYRGGGNMTMRMTHTQLSRDAWPL